MSMLLSGNIVRDVYQASDYHDSSLGEPDSELHVIAPPSLSTIDFTNGPLQSSSAWGGDSMLPLPIGGEDEESPPSSRLLPPPTFRNGEHPRLRTQQACEKCRARKAKCSGDHPSCGRCLNRGLVCVYAAEAGRMRGPNKTKTTEVLTPSHHNQNNGKRKRRSIDGAAFHIIGRAATTGSSSTSAAGRTSSARKRCSLPQPLQSFAPMQLATSSLSPSPSSGSPVEQDGNVFTMDQNLLLPLPTSSSPTTPMNTRKRPPPLRLDSSSNNLRRFAGTQTQSAGLVMMQSSPHMSLPPPSIHQQRRQQHHSHSMSVPNAQLAFQPQRRGYGHGHGQSQSLSSFGEASTYAMVGGGSLLVNEFSPFGDMNVDLERDAVRMRGHSRYSSSSSSNATFSSAPTSALPSPLPLMEDMGYYPNNNNTDMPQFSPGQYLNPFATNHVEAMFVEEDVYARTPLYDTGLGQTPSWMGGDNAAGAAGIQQYYVAASPYMHPGPEYLGAALDEYGAYSSNPELSNPKQNELNSLDGLHSMA